jgi:DNA sulfur modification protein DndB
MATVLKPTKPLNVASLGNSMTLPAIKYISGKREWINITMDYLTVGKFIKPSRAKKKGESLLPSEILNRFLDPKHKNDIKEYIKSEPRFIIPPITLVSMDSLNFQPLSIHENDDNLTEEELLEKHKSLIGYLILPLSSRFICMDGNHRSVAIEELAEDYPELLEGSSLSLNIVYESDPRKIRQDFVDVNKNAKATSPSINTLFNTRDPLSNIVADILDTEWIKDLTELLSPSVSKNAKQIYTINNIKNAVVELANVNSQSSTQSLSKKLSQNEDFKIQLELRIEHFFSTLKQNNFISNCVTDMDNVPDIREKSIITSGIGLTVMARVAGQIYERFEDYEQRIQQLMEFEWSRSNPFFLGKLLSETGKIISSNSSMRATADALLEKFASESTL